MQTGQGLRQYFYEHLYFHAVERVREETGALVPISQARHIRSRVDDLLVQRGVTDNGLGDPRLFIAPALGAINEALVQAVPDAQPVFPMDGQDRRLYGQLESAFMAQTGLGGDAPADSRLHRLPISPYDPRWAARSSVRANGAQLSYLSDEQILRATNGVTASLHERVHGGLTISGRQDSGEFVDRGPALTDEDASGLSALAPLMSQKEYEDVKKWVVLGGVDPQTRQVDHTRFMSDAATARSVAVLQELRQQGLTYEIKTDRRPGQIKARVHGSGLEVRLIDPANEAYAGARFYRSGVEMRYTTDKRNAVGVETPSVSPAQAVDLLHLAQGRAVTRRDGSGLLIGATGAAHVDPNARKPTRIQDAYVDGRVSMMVAGDYGRAGNKLLVRREAREQSLPTYFATKDESQLTGSELVNAARANMSAIAKAEQFGAEAVASAQANFVAALDVETLIEHARDQRAIHGDVRDQFDAPDYSPDMEIAAIQRSYWDVLTGSRTDLLRPGATEQMYSQRLDAIGEQGLDPSTALGNLVYSGSAEERVRAHAADAPFELIGTWEPEAHVEGETIVDRRFEPARVAKYMTSSVGQWSNLENLAAAARRVEIRPEEIMGTGFQSQRFKNNIVDFDPHSSVPMHTHDSAFIRWIGATVLESIQRNSATADPERVRIDARGVISWTAQPMGRTGPRGEITGTIGQVFDRGEYGEIVTNFASGENALIVPGFQARIEAQRPDQPWASVEQRTRLRGYEQLMTERIQQQIADDMVSGRTEVGTPASLNGVYSGIYGSKHPVDFIERATTYAREVDGTIVKELDSWTQTIVETEAKRVRYSNEVRAGSTIYAEYQAQSSRRDPVNDNHTSAWDLTGGRNMAVLTGADTSGLRAPAGYFDPVMTGSAENQGIVRYLTADAVVRADGQIVPGDPNTVSGTRAPLMAREELETLRFDPFDRQAMTASTIMQSAEVTRPRGTALMTFGGWTADDPIVVSREFSEDHQIRGANGAMRPLVVGDKLSDLHGNKGVVSLIVDRAMDPEQAEAAGLSQEVAWFRDNPEMDVVMSPFSLISRRNAGSARELMDDEVTAIAVPDESREAVGKDRLLGGLGQMRFVVTHMAVDDKTKIYDEDAIRAGKGRKASSQLAWALQAQGCDAVMREFYAPNAGAEANLREYLLVTGLDMDADSRLRVVGVDEALDEAPTRRMIQMPELILNQPRAGSSDRSLNTTAMRRAFGELIGDRGGDMEIPFPLNYPTGQRTEQHTANSWKVPVLSSHLRSGQQFDDGTSVTHDYTHSYQDIHVQACRFRHAGDQLEAQGLSSTKRAQLQQVRTEAVAQAQRAFDAITTPIRTTVLTEKNNVFKTGLMSSRLPDSATMVWTSDPRLDIDEVALSSSKAAQLGLAEGDHALVWRDPVLRDAGVRYMRVKLNDELTGAAINPVMAGPFDGDFDGDAVAVVNLHSKAAQAEALEKLSVQANLLDRGVTYGDQGASPLAMNISLDTQVSLSQDAALRATVGEIEMALNDDEAVDARALTHELSDFYRSAQREQFGAALDFSSPRAHAASVAEVCVQTGAKGSEAKLYDYLRYAGIQVNTPDSTAQMPVTQRLRDERTEVTELRDERGESTSGITRQDQEDSMFAAAIKAHGTGLGGKFSQRAVRALRDEDLKAVLEVTYPVTQSILQAKHDASEARHKYAMLMGAGRELWRGRVLEYQGRGEWSVPHEDGTPMQATRDAWVAQCTHFYTSAQGFGVKINPAYVEKVAEALVDPQTGLMRNLEDDPSLQGTLLDRMAYGAKFKDLVEAAKNREVLFDGRGAQFASTATRNAVYQTQRALQDYETTGTLPEASVVSQRSVAVQKSDVLESGQARGANVRSVAAHTGRRELSVAERAALLDVPELSADPAQTQMGL